MKPDPIPRADGRCARAGCSKPIAIKRHAKVPPAAYAGEPFCSTECCKVYHGVELSTYSDTTGLGSKRGRQRTAA